MKKFSICYEVQGAAVDEAGNPAPAGVKLELGEIPDETYDQAMKCRWEADPISVFACLGLACVAKSLKLEDFRPITPEEYAEKHGDDDEN